MRLLISADIHIGSPIRSIALRNEELGDRLKNATRDTFTRIVDLAIAEQVDALVLAGDIFDSGIPDVRSSTFLLNQLARAWSEGVPTVLIRGNHDALLDHTARGKLGDGIHLLDKKQPTVQIKDIAFHGLSFDRNHQEQSLLPGYPEPIPGVKNVGLMHTALDNTPGHDPYAPCATKDLLAHGYDVWCLGHIHAPIEHKNDSTLIVMPGIPQPRHIGERHGGFVNLVSLDDGVIACEQIKVGQLAFVERHLDLSDCQDQTQLYQTLLSTMKAEKIGGLDVALRLIVTTNTYPGEVLKELALEIQEQLDTVYIEKIKTTLPRREPTEEADDLIRLMREQLSTPGVRQNASDTMRLFRDTLPPEIRNAFPDSDEPHFDDVLNELLEEAIKEVTVTVHQGQSS